MSANHVSRFFSLIVLAAACSGGSKPAATTPPAASTAQAVSTTPSKESIAAFHEVLAPLWHAPEGAERTANTCAAAPQIEKRAQDVGDATLVEAVHALGAECSGDRKAFQEKFTAVHSAFHVAAEKAGATEEKKEEAKP